MKKQKEKVLVSVQNTYYEINDSLCNVTEESLLDLDPVAGTRTFVSFEKNDDFISNVKKMLNSCNLIPGYVGKKCNVCHTVMCFGEEVVYMSIQNIGLFCGE